MTSSYKSDINLEKALEQFEQAESELALLLKEGLSDRVEVTRRIHNVVIANRDWAYALERIHAYSGVIPKQYVARYNQDVSRCVRDLDRIHYKGGLDVSNWLSLIRLSRVLVNSIKTF